MTTFNIPAGFSSRVADLLHLLEFADIDGPSRGDSEQARSVMAELRADLALAPPVDAVVGEPVDAETWAELYRLREAVKGPKGFATWQDAAVDERHRRVKAERALATPAVSRAEGLEPLPELFGLSFSEARSRILAMPLDDARRMTISLLIQFGIVQKYATPIAPAAPAEPSELATSKQALQVAGRAGVASLVASEDTRRLDLLESVVASDQWIIARNRDSFTVSLDPRHKGSTTRKTLREAIDAASAGEAQS